MCYYFNNIIKNRYIIVSNILLDKKLYENISVYDFSYKTGPKSLRIRFNKIDRFIRVCGGEFKNLVLLNYGLFNKIFDKIKYLLSEKSGITDVII